MKKSDNENDTLTLTQSDLRAVYCPRAVRETLSPWEDPENVNQNDYIPARFARMLGAYNIRPTDVDRGLGFVADWPQGYFERSGGLTSA